MLTIGDLITVIGLCATLFGLGYSIGKSHQDIDVTRSASYIYD